MRAPIFALALLASPACASEEHRVILTGLTYFPSITYAQPGDTVRFINQSGEEQTVVGRDSGWTIGPLADLEESLLDVTEETELTFFAAYVVGEGDEETPGTYEDAEIRAAISFDPAPLGGD